MLSYNTVRSDTSSEWFQVFSHQNHFVPDISSGMNCFVLVTLYHFSGPKFTISTCYYIKTDFDQIHIDIFYKFQAFDELWQEFKRFDDLTKQTKAILGPWPFG